MLGESPLWSHSEGVLWWVDIRRAKLHRWNPATQRSRRMDLPIRASALAMWQGSLLMAGDREIGVYDPETEDYERRVLLEDEPDTSRTNDGQVAPDGSFWFGTMDKAEADVAGHLYRYGKRGGVIRVNAPPVMVTNTLSWAPDGKTFYTCDSAEQEILAFDADPATGDLSGRRVFATTSDVGAYPDGSAIDAEGYLWNAQWDGACVARYAPDGRVDRIVEMPVPRPTSVCFGGADMKTLYITSARTGLTEDDLERRPMSGGLFAIDVDVPGVPVPEFGGDKE